MPSSSSVRERSVMSVRALRERLGDNGIAGLEEVIDDAGTRWKDNVLEITAERFERRLAEEMAAMRVDLAKEFAALRTDMAKEFAAVRGEMGTLRFDLVKWCFVFWIGQVAGITAVIAFLFRNTR